MTNAKIFISSLYYEWCNSFVAILTTLLIVIAGMLLCTFFNNLLLTILSIYGVSMMACWFSDKLNKALKRTF